MGDSEMGRDIYAPLQGHRVHQAWLAAMLCTSARAPHEPHRVAQSPCTFARAPRAPCMGCGNAMQLCKSTSCTTLGLQQCCAPLQGHHVHRAWLAAMPCTSARAPSTACTAPCSLQGRLACQARLAAAPCSVHAARMRCSSAVLRACSEDALQQRRAPCMHQGCAAALLCSVQSRSMHRGCAAA